jgi:hypothetical protein
MERADLIRKLVKTRHLSVSERRQLREPPRVEEVVAVVVDELLRQGFFPRRPWREGEPCGDGVVLELLADGRARAQHQVSTACMRPAHLDEVEFPDAQAAALHLVEKDFSGGIDGILLANDGGAAGRAED